MVNSSGFVAAPPAIAPAAPVVPSVRYNLVAPQNIRPFAAQVSAFARGLSVYNAPYAAGVLNYPAVVNTALAPVAPAHVFSSPPTSPFATAPVVPSWPAAVPASVVPAFASAPAPAAIGSPLPLPAPAVSAPIFPSQIAPAAFLPAFTSGPILPAPVIPEPAPVIPALYPPLARSIHAISPGLAPPVVPALPAAPLLG